MNIIETLPFEMGISNDYRRAIHNSIVNHVYNHLGGGHDPTKCLSSVSKSLYHSMKYWLVYRILLGFPMISRSWIIRIPNILGSIIPSS